MVSLQRRTRRAFTWVLIIPVLLGILTFWVAVRYRDSISWVSHTKDVLVATDGLLASVTGAESNQRGFLLIEEEAFRKRYFNERDALPKQLAYLAQLTADNPKQQLNVKRLSTTLQARIGKMDYVLALGRNRDLEPNAMEAVREGAELMTSIRQICLGIKGTEVRLLDVRNAVQRRTEVELAVCFTLGITISIFLLYGAQKRVQRYATARDQAEVELRALNADLEARVRERTAELEELNQQLSRSNRDLTQFAYVASHDLQEPLRTIGSYAGLLGRRYQGKFDEQGDKYIRYLIDGSKRMQSLVQDLLAYSRVGMEAIKHETVETGAVLERAKDDLKLAIAERGAQITNDPLPQLKVDAQRLTQVFQNLVGNALKFGKPGQTVSVHIRAFRCEREWVFVVSDNGIGFEPEYAEKIFLIFQRLHRVGAYPGTGIGLAICKRIIDAHGGRIWADSEPGIGSNFFFTLPMEPKLKRRETDVLEQIGAARDEQQTGETVHAHSADRG
jgi:signal transduction histidine kinase